MDGDQYAVKQTRRIKDKLNIVDRNLPTLLLSTVADIYSDHLKHVFQV